MLSEICLSINALVTAFMQFVIWNVPQMQLITCLFIQIKTIAYISWYNSAFNWENVRGCPRVKVAFWHTGDSIAWTGRHFDQLSLFVSINYRCDHFPSMSAVICVADPSMRVYRIASAFANCIHTVAPVWMITMWRATRRQDIS